MSASTDNVYEINEYERQHYMRVDALRRSLREHLDASRKNLNNAVTVLGQLRANDIEDFLFTEGRDGDDIAAFLNDSIRNVRAAYAVTQIITDKDTP